MDILIESWLSNREIGLERTDYGGIIKKMHASAGICIL